MLSQQELSQETFYTIDIQCRVNSDGVEYYDITLIDTQYNVYTTYPTVGMDNFANWKPITNNPDRCFEISGKNLKYKKDRSRQIKVSSKGFPVINCDVSGSIEILGHFDLKKSLETFKEIIAELPPINHQMDRHDIFEGLN